VIFVPNSGVLLLTNFFQRSDFLADIFFADLIAEKVQNTEYARAVVFANKHDVFNEA
jgi:hypothetical protein